MKEWEKELDEIRSILAETARRQVEAVKWQEEAARRQEETARWQEEAARRQEEAMRETARRQEEAMRETARRQEEAARETARWQEEAARRQEEAARRQEETARETARRQEETARRQEETARRQEEAVKWLDDYKKENKEAFAELRKNIFGISSSNGMAAEDYFFDSVYKTKVFGGNHFDLVRRNLNSKFKDENGKECKTELDILLTNDVAVCIIEVKYRARKDDVLDLAGDKVAKFRKLFPEYANYKLYLGLGAMSFEKGVEAEAKARGIGILKANGDAVEIDDVDLKAY